MRKGLKHAQRMYAKELAIRRLNGPLARKISQQLPIHSFEILRSHSDELVIVS